MYGAKDPDEFIRLNGPEVFRSLIEKSENEKVEKSLLGVMPDGKNFKKIETAPDGLADTVKEIYSENGGGYVFKLVTTGYSAGLTIMCGIDSNGKITGATCVSSGETLGNEKTYGELFLGADKGTVDSVDSVSGATKTTANYKKALKDALSAFDILKGAAK